jgi:hypothetical protein
MGPIFKKFQKYQLVSEFAYWQWDKGVNAAMDEVQRALTAQYASHGFSTRAIHSGQAPDATTGAVVPPISLSTTFAHTSPGRHVCVCCVCVCVCMCVYMCMWFSPISLSYTYLNTNLHTHLHTTHSHSHTHTHSHSHTLTLALTLTLTGQMTGHYDYARSNNPVRL